MLIYTEKKFISQSSGGQEVQYQGIAFWWKAFCCIEPWWKVEGKK
jgi:hypothetical protein